MERVFLSKRIARRRRFIQAECASDADLPLAALLTTPAPRAPPAPPTLPRCRGAARRGVAYRQTTAWQPRPARPSTSRARSHPAHAVAPPPSILFFPRLTRGHTARVRLGRLTPPRATRVPCGGRHCGARHRRTGSPVSTGRVQEPRGRGLGEPSKLGSWNCKARHDYVMRVFTNQRGYLRNPCCCA